MGFGRWRTAHGNRRKKAVERNDRLRLKRTRHIKGGRERAISYMQGLPKMCPVCPRIGNK